MHNFNFREKVSLLRNLPLWNRKNTIRKPRFVPKWTCCNKWLNIKRDPPPLVNPDLAKRLFLQLWYIVNGPFCIYCQFCWPVFKLYLLIYFQCSFHLCFIIIEKEHTKKPKQLYFPIKIAEKSDSILLSYGFPKIVAKMTHWDFLKWLKHFFFYP